MGGEGVFLVLFFYYVLVKYLGLMVLVVFLNIGGVVNLMWVDFV